MHPDFSPDISDQHLVAEWVKFPIATFQNLVESVPKRVEGVAAEKGTNLEWDFQ